MAQSAQEFESARSKIQRANSHIGDLIATYQSFLKTDFCKLVVEDDGKPGGYWALKIEATTPYPPEIPLIVGDAFHNLRSSLDHIIVQFTGQDRFSLPTGKKRDDVIAVPMYGSIKKAFPDFISFILDEIQPYAGGKFKCWELSQMDNIDKHRLIIPTVNISSLMGADFEDSSGNRFRNANIAVEHGTVQPIIIGGGGRMKINDKGTPALNIRFGDGTPFKDETVLETLANLAQLTLQAVEAFELFCFGQITNPNPSERICH